MKSPRIKILNKSKDGVTLFVGKPVKISWDLFNKDYVIDSTNNKYCLMNEQRLKAQERYEDLVAQVLVQDLIIQKDPTNLNAVALLGSLTQELCELTGATIQELVLALRVEKQRFIDRSINLGVNPDAHNTQWKSRKNSRKIEEKVQMVTTEPGMSIGDMIKAKENK